MEPIGTFGQGSTLGTHTCFTVGAKKKFVIAALDQTPLLPPQEYRFGEQDKIRCLPYSATGNSSTTPKETGNKSFLPQLLSVRCTAVPVARPGNVRVGP